jgi:hypothetical protein
MNPRRDKIHLTTGWLGYMPTTCHGQQGHTLGRRAERLSGADRPGFQLENAGLILVIGSLQV